MLSPSARVAWVGLIVATMATPLPVAAFHAEYGLRPGVPFWSAGDIGCTLGFFFRGLGPGGGVSHHFASTAKHCTRNVGDWVELGGNPKGNPFGEVYYRSPVGDFALLRIGPGFVASADPSVCYWGGPTAMASTDEFERVPVPKPWEGPWPDVGLVEPGYRVEYYGQGGITAYYLRPRTGDVTNAFPHTFGFLGGSAAGDSGSPVLSNDGRALGLILGGQSLAAGTVPVAPGLVLASRLELAVAQAEQDLGLHLELWMAPANDPPVHEPSCGTDDPIADTLADVACRPPPEDVVAATERWTAPDQGRVVGVVSIGCNGERTLAPGRGRDSPCDMWSGLFECHVVFEEPLPA